MQLSTGRRQVIYWWSAPLGPLAESPNVAHQASPSPSPKGYSRSQTMNAVYMNPIFGKEILLKNKYNDNSIGYFFLFLALADSLIIYIHINCATLQNYWLYLRTVRTYV